MYQKLETVIEKIDFLNGSDVKCEVLSGGLTNENYVIFAGDSKYVLRIPGHGSEVMINREYELANSINAAKVNVSPKVLQSVKPDYSMVIEYLEGEVMHPETVAADNKKIRKIGNALKTLKNNTEFVNETYVFDMMRQYYKMCQEVRAILPHDFDWIRLLMDDIENAMETNKPELAPSHNDLLSENFIIDPDDKIWIIDWEYGGMNDPYFDLGDICVEHPLSEEQERLLLQSYSGAEEYQEYCRMKLHKLTADVWWGMWGMIQHKISKLDFDFYTYGIRRFERFRKNYYEGEYKNWIDGV
jgi:thiamine kinase-like enzyme